MRSCLPLIGQGGLRPRLVSSSPPPAELADCNRQAAARARVCLPRCSGGEGEVSRGTPNTFAILDVCVCVRVCVCVQARIYRNRARVQQAPPGASMLFFCARASAESTALAAGPQGGALGRLPRGVVSHERCWPTHGPAWSTAPHSATTASRGGAGASLSALRIRKEGWIAAKRAPVLLFLRGHSVERSSCAFLGVPSAGANPTGIEAPMS
mmetsp:Transcript_61945/g.178314  ORF Transcript_61945/g.178314 Transcript_61945/m.178314 type:complete len:211 (-) Transcript_61945:34-666(-)